MNTAASPTVLSVGHGRPDPGRPHGTFLGPCIPCPQFNWLMSPRRDDTELWYSLYRTDTLAAHG